MRETTVELPTIAKLHCADPECRVEFTPRNPWQKYHSARCRKRHWWRRRIPKPGVALVCPKCGASLALQLRSDG